MTARDDGGPAMPQAHYFMDGSPKVPEGPWRGMSLRDYFAGLALQGMFAGGTNLPDKEISEAAYAAADAMLKARAA